MMQLWSTLLAFLFARSSLARWIARVFSWLDLFEEVLANPEEHLRCRSPEGRRMIEAYVARLEDWIQFLTNARAAELAGLTRTYTEDTGGHLWTPHTPRDWDSLIQRYQRMRQSFTRIERMARRRAARLKRQLADNPLTIIDPLAALAATPIMAAVREVLHRRRRERWIATSSSRDGGGCALARGPPPTQFTEFSSPHLAGPACAIASAYPSALTVAVMNPPPSTLRPPGAA